MAKSRAPAEDRPLPKSYLGQMLYTKRQTYFFAFFVLYCVLDIVLLGLVSEQIHKHGNEASGYPSAEYYHAFGLLLFASIFYLLFGLFHWALGHMLYFFCFISGAVFFGTGAGIIEGTPFGHGLQCKNPASSFRAQWRPFVSDCSRVTAVEGFAWAMFALSVIGLFAAFADRFSFSVKNDHVYAPYVAPQKEKIADEETAAH